MKYLRQTLSYRTIGRIFLLALVFSGIICSVFVTDAAARSRVQKFVELNYDGDELILDIDDVDTGKSFVWFSFKTEMNNPLNAAAQYHDWAARFTDAAGSPSSAGTHVTLNRSSFSGTGTTAGLVIYVIESDAFEVEYVEHPFVVDDYDETVDLSGSIDFTDGYSFVIGRWCTESNSNNANDINALYFTSEIIYNTAPTVDQVNFLTSPAEDGSTPAREVWAFVVQLRDDSEIQRGESWMEESSFYAKGTLSTAVDRTKSTMFFSTRIDESALGSELRGSIPSDTEVAFNRRASGSSYDEGWAYWYVWELGTLGSVQSGGILLDTASGDPDPYYSILGTAVDVDLAFSMSTQDSTGSGTYFWRIRRTDETYNETLDPQTGRTMCDMLEFDRMEGGQQAVVDWFVVQLEPMRLIAPNGGGTPEGFPWIAGEQYEIIWYAPDQITNVQLLLSYDGGTNYAGTISSSTANDGSFMWTVPDTANWIDDDLLIKVRDTNWNEMSRPESEDFYCSDVSDAEFETICQIEVTYPDGYEDITFEDTLNITWTFYGDPTGRTVTIKYSDNGGSSYDYTIDTLVPAGNETYPLNWTTDPLPLNNFLKIKVEQTGEETRVFDTSDDNFSVKGEIALQYPVGGETWLVGNTYYVLWTWKGDEGFRSEATGGGVEIKLSLDDGITWPTLITTAPIDADNDAGGHATYSNFPWTAVPALTTLAKVKVTSVDNPLISDESPVAFTIDSTITVTSPTSASLWEIGTLANITWTYTGTLANVDILLSRNSGGTWDPIGTTAASAGPGVGFDFDPVTGPGGTVNKIKIRSSTYPTYIYGISDNDADTFTIQETIVVDNPSTGNVLKVNDPLTVQWTIDGAGVTSVDIAYDSGSGYGAPFVMDEPTAEGADSYGWAVPNDISDTVTVKVSDNARPAIYGESGVFKIKAKINVYEPAANQKIQIGDSTNYVRWTVEGTYSAPQPTVYVRISTDGGTSYSPSVGSAEITAGQLQWTPGAGYAGSDCVVKVGFGVVDPGENDITGTAGVSAGFFIRDIYIDPASESNGGGAILWKIDETHAIDWHVDGGVGDVYLYYSLDGGTGWNNVTSGVTPVVVTCNSTGDYQYNWDIPEDAIGNNERNSLIKFKAETTDTAVKGISDQNLTIQEQFDTLVPSDGTQTWYAGQSENITWDTKGFGGTVTLYYDKISGTNGYNNFIVGPITNVDGYVWPIPEEAISETVRIRVESSSFGEHQSDPNPISVSSVNDFKIKPSLLDVSPTGSSNVWYVGETDKVISWTARGAVTNVMIEYKTSAGGTYVPIVANDPGHTDGFNSYTWSAGVADEKSADCYIRVSDANNLSMSAESADPFCIWPQITLDGSIDTDTKLVAFSNNPSLVKWSATGSKINTVNVRYDLNGGAGADTIPGNGDDYVGVIQNNALIGDGVAGIDWSPCADISNTVKIRVADTDENVYEANVKADTPVFKIIGELILTAPLGAATTWTAETTNNVAWTFTGTIASVNIYYDLNSLDGDQWTPILPVSNKSQTGNSGADSIGWDLPTTVTNNARIRITNAADETNTDSIGADFKIGAAFAITFPFDGDDDVYAEDIATTIDWDTDNGTGINKV
ncbi:MAG: hypothetical protein GY853_13125, partial [PVC group bacterium]|nr:hypothetical protein [PVC group bacterium]